MAKMNINIINPTISLISRPVTSSNKCESISEFTIKSTPNASITIAATIPTDTLNGDDLRELSYDLGAGYNTVSTKINIDTEYPFISDPYIKKIETVLNDTGEAKVRVVLANSEEAGKFYTTQVFVKDNTNNKEETKKFTRYDDNIKCKIGSEPIAVDDNYTVTKGTQNSLDITKNDERLHYITDLNKITFVTQPTHGTVDFILGSASYKNNGDAATSDSFTYTVETPNGLSNVATVNISINEIPQYKWLAGGIKRDNGSNILKSIDGDTWIEGEISELEHVRFFKYIDSKWYAGGSPSSSGGATLLISEDLNNWTAVSNPMNLHVTDITKKGGRYVITGLGTLSDGSKVTISSSLDLIDWYNISIPTSFDVIANGVKVIDGTFIAVGEPDHAGDTGVTYSTDGVSWIKIEDDKGIANGRDLIYFKGKYYVSGGFYGLTIIYSDTLSGVWTAVNTSLDIYGWGIKVLNDKLIAVGKGTHEVATSTDGINFNTYIVDNTYALGDSATDGNKVIAVGAQDSNTGKIVKTTEGTTWTTIHTTPIELYSISYYGES